MNKKAVSPLIATILLVVFALVFGAITMSWGKAYVEGVEEEKGPESALDVLNGAIIISIKNVDTPLKSLQIQHITDQLTEEEYLKKEKEIVGNSQ